MKSRTTAHSSSHSLASPREITDAKVCAYVCACVDGSSLLSIFFVSVSLLVLPFTSLLPSLCLSIPSFSLSPLSLTGLVTLDGKVVTVEERIQAVQAINRKENIDALRFAFVVWICIERYFLHRRRCNLISYFGQRQMAERERGEGVCLCLVFVLYVCSIFFPHTHHYTDGDGT